MRFRLPFVAAVVLVALSCGGTRSGPSRPDAATGLTAFTTGTWEFRVDRSWDGVSGNPQLPSDVLDESCYRPVAGGPTYRVVVSDDGWQVAIDGTLRGARTKVTEVLVEYDITAGLFAGGRFDVRLGGNGLQGELTVYGSGRAIVKSERGAVTMAR